MMAVIKQIEVWFTSGINRECIDASSLTDALRKSKSLSSNGMTGICVDVTYFENGDLLEERSKWYSFNGSKLKPI